MSKASKEAWVMEDESKTGFSLEARCAWKNALLESQIAIDT